MSVSLAVAKLYQHVEIQLCMSIYREREREGGRRFNGGKYREGSLEFSVHVWLFFSVHNYILFFWKMKFALFLFNLLQCKLCLVNTFEKRLSYSRWSRE